MNMTINTRLMTWAVVIGLLAAPSAVLAGGNASAGKAKSATCQACHGIDGKSIDPSYPNLAGQHASYLEKALKDYRDGRRTNAIMAPMAMALSDQDIEDIAAWYAKQDGLEDLSIK